MGEGQAGHDQPDVWLLHVRRVQRDETETETERAERLHTPVLQLGLLPRDHLPVPSPAEHEATARVAPQSVLLSTRNEKPVRHQPWLHIRTPARGKAHATERLPGRPDVE